MSTHLNLTRLDLSDFFPLHSVCQCGSPWIFQALPARLRIGEIIIIYELLLVADPI